MAAMKDEVQQRLDEIDRISLASNFNGLQLLAGEGTLAEQGLRLQVGANSDAAANCIQIDADFFADAMNSENLGTTYNGQIPAGSLIKPADGLSGNIDAAFTNASNAAAYIDVLDAAIDNISTKKSTIGATMNRLDAALSSLTTVIENNTAAKSTIMDADIAEESAEYTKAQILQQTSSALLVQANALPQIAINLVQG